MEEERALKLLERELRARVSRFDAIVFGVSLALCLLVHLYMFTHKFLNHDDVDGLYSSCAFGLSSGRWLLETICGLTGNFSSSWLNGLAGSLCLALAATFMAKLFRLRHLTAALLAALCVVSFPTVASTYAYMFSSFPYLFALALSVLGAWLIRREGRGRTACGAACIALSMGCYQAYFALTATLLVAALILDVCDDRWGGDCRAFFRTAVKHVAALALGMALYYGVLRFLLWHTGTELVAYQGIGRMGQITLPILLQRIAYAYGAYVLTLTGRMHPIFHGLFYLLAPLCVAVGLAAVAAYVAGRRLYRQRGMMVFLVLLLAAFPLASGLIYVMTEWWSVHLLMIYPMVVTLLLPAVVLDRLPMGREGRERGLSLGLAGALLCLSLACGYEFVLVTNRAYFSMDVTYENVYAYYTKLAAKLELQEGFTPESRVALIGRAAMNSYVPPTYMTGVLVGDDALNIYSRGYYLSYFLASDYHYVSQADAEALRQTGAFAAMPCYPAEGSIAAIDGVIVVKLSE